MHLNRFVEAELKGNLVLLCARTLQGDDLGSSIGAIERLLVRSRELVIAFAPVIPSLRLFELHDRVGQYEHKLAALHCLAPKSQSDLFFSSDPGLRGGRRNPYLLELDAICQSLEEQPFDRLALEARSLGQDAIARWPEAHRQLLKLIERHKSETIDWFFPDREPLQLHLPSLGPLERVDPPIRMRALVTNCAFSYAILARPDVETAPGDWQALTNVRRGMIRLSWDASTPSNALRAIRDAIHTREVLEMTVRVKRVGTSSRPVEALLIHVPEHVGESVPIPQNITCRTRWS